MSFEEEFTGSKIQPEGESVGDVEGGATTPPVEPNTPPAEPTNSKHDDKIQTEIHKEIFKICKERKFTDTLTDAFILHAPTLDDWRKDPDIIKTLAKKVSVSKDKTLTGEDRFKQITDIIKTQNDIGQLYQDRVEPDAEYQSRQVDEQEKKRIAEIRSMAAKIEYNKALKEGYPKDICVKRARQAAVDAEKAEREPTAKDIRTERTLKKLQDEKQEEESKADLVKKYPNTMAMLNYIEEGEWGVIGRLTVEYAKPMITPNDNVYWYQNGVYETVSPKYKKSIDILTNHMLYNTQYEEDPDHLTFPSTFLQEQIKKAAHRNDIARDVNSRENQKWSDFEGDDGYIAFADKLVTMENKKVVTEKFTPKIKVFYKIPHKFPDKPSPHPKFDSYLRKACSTRDHERDIRKENNVWQIIAAILMRNIWGIQFYVQLLGPPGTTKGTLIEIIKMIVGEDNTKNIKLSMFDRKDEGGFNIFGQMVNKTFCYDGDTRNLRYFDGAFLSDTVGRGAVDIHNKYEEPYSVRLKAPFLFASTELEYRIKDTLLRRMELIEFCRVVQGKGVTGTITNYHKEIKDEIPGIIYTALRWAEKISEYRASGEQGECHFIGSLTHDEKREILNLWQPDNPIDEILHTYFEKSDKDNVLTYKELRDMVEEYLKVDYSEEDIERYLGKNNLAKHEMVRRNKRVSGSGGKRTYMLKLKTTSDGGKLTNYTAPSDTTPTTPTDNAPSDTAPTTPTDTTPTTPGPDDTTPTTPETPTISEYTPLNWPDGKPSPKDVIQKCEEYKMPHGVAKTFMHKIDDHYMDNNQDLIVSETMKFWDVQEPQTKHRSSTLREILNWFTSFKNVKV